MSIPNDYAERVYAGVLGKLIGVYLGRPFEGWTHERIMAELGEVDYYIHERRGVPLIVTDDDITGTFTFLRALADYGNGLDLTPAQIGQTWLNYTIERRTIFWWGGLGNSTEHTAYLRLKHGIPAPESGAIATNGQTIAEQIGAQIFIDGWGMVAPGDPELAADLARRAASVSHDGAAIHGAQVIAAMEAAAFVESDRFRLLDTATSLIPRDSIIFRLIDDVRAWYAAESDWRATRGQIAATYGYDKYRGPCHMVPNHALIILALLYGDDDFQRSLMIVNTAGWDTDCNSGNVGCILGIKHGLAALDAGPDWRGPIADRLYLPTTDGGRAITDAATETLHVVNAGRALAGLPPEYPKDGAHFHFEFPGSVQGFRAAGAATLENVAGHSAQGQRCLAIRCQDASWIFTPTFIPPDTGFLRGYELLASPTLYPGQTLHARIEADSANKAPVTCRLAIRAYGAEDALTTIAGPEVSLAPGAAHTFTWQLADTGGAPIADVGLEIGPAGTIYLDSLTWDGAPAARFTRTADGGKMWRRAWVDAVDQFQDRWPESLRINQNEGTGLLIQGTRDWTDYRVAATITPYLAKSAGIAARVQGLRRYYALLLSDNNTARIVKALDGVTTLAETPFSWDYFQSYELSLEVIGSRLRATVDGRLLFDVEDADRPLTGGALALICEEGCLGTDAVIVFPPGLGG